jgi:putative phosphoribosyl transferase
MPLPFADRDEAGRELAAALAPLRDEEGVSIGLVHGGVVVADAVAEVLGLDLGALCVRKVGHPLQPEYALGAVAPDGVTVLQDPGDPNVSPTELQRALEAAREASSALERKLGPAPPVAGRLCVMVDDGLATGATMVAALRWARKGAAHRVVVAVPVAPPDRLALVRRDADDAVALHTPEPFRGVGRWYRDFSPVSDEEVARRLALRRRERSGE